MSASPWRSPRAAYSLLALPISASRSAALEEAGAATVDVQHIPAWVLKRAHRRQLTAMEQAERDLIIDALASAGNNRTDAARILGIGRATLYRKLRTLEISSGEVLAR